MSNTVLAESEDSDPISSIDIKAHSMDSLVEQAIQLVLSNGSIIYPRAGKALQCYGVNYILMNSRSRVHGTRKPAVRYFARELLAYFKGSLNANEGLVQASKFWKNLANESGHINSNYGYYVFRAGVDSSLYRTQYEWVIKRLSDNLHSRRAIININQGYHKSETKDFPCTVALHFFVRDNRLCCDAYSRSTDVITGLPYDLGFFSLLTELVHADLVERGQADLKLGYTMLKATFTQIYERSMGKAYEVLEHAGAPNSLAMPTIDRASELLADIYDGTHRTDFMKWIYQHAEVENLTPMSRAANEL